MMESLSYEEEKILKGIRNISRMKKRTKLHCNLRYKKSNQIRKTLKDIKNHFEHEEENYHKPLRVSNFGVSIILNMKVTTMKIKHYQLKNILIKLDHK